MRPVLSPGVRVTWRSDDTLQVGVDPARALVVDGLGEQTRPLLDLLDGVHDWDAVVREAELLGTPDPERVLGCLRSAGLLADARGLEVWAVTSPQGREGARRRLSPDLAAAATRDRSDPDGTVRLLGRERQRVDVWGAGRLGSHLACLLAAAGVGTVKVTDPRPVRIEDPLPGGLTPADVGKPRSLAVTAALAEWGARRPRDADGGEQRPDLVVVCPDRPVADHSQRALLMTAAIPHLLVVVRDSAATVGPLVVPGEAACLGCLDLHRRDRDPAWPVVAAQLETGRLGHAEASDTVVVARASALAAAQALAWLDAGRRAGADGLAVLGATLELDAGDWRVRRRVWGAHAACSCEASGGHRAEVRRLHREEPDGDPA